MKKTIFEEVKRIKEIMLISESNGSGLITKLAETFGFFDNLATKTESIFTNLNRTDVIKANDLKYGLADIASRKVTSISDPYSLSPRYLVQAISKQGDNAAKLELIQFLNRSSDEIASETASLIKNNEKLLQSISDIDENILRGELSNLGLKPNFVDEIAQGFYVKPDILKSIFEKWDVDWDNLGGLRGEFVKGIEDLNVNRAFMEKYKTIISDKSWMTNTIKKLSSEVKTKTPEELKNYLDEEMSKYLQELTKLAKEGKLPKEDANAIIKWWRWSKASEQWANQNIPTWKKTTATVWHFYLGVLLPLASIIEGIQYTTRSETDIENDWRTTEEGKTAWTEYKKDNDYANYYDKFIWWQAKNLAYEIGSTSTIIPRLLGSTFLGAVGFKGTNMTQEEKIKKGQDLIKKFEKAQQPSPTPTPVPQTPTPVPQTSQKSKSEPTIKRGELDNL